MAQFRYDENKCKQEGAKAMRDKIAVESESEDLSKWKIKIQKAYTEIWKTQIYPYETKGQPKADDILKKHFPFLKPE